LKTQGAFYGDDAQVTVHELQHATTQDNYSLNADMNQLNYDEAGALNEAISDFMSLVFSDTIVPPNPTIDPRVFSRWALGMFDPKSSHLRGAHKCPTYDSHYPNCDRFPAFELPSGTNGNSITLSYVYPDGLGWPYPNNYGGASGLKNTIENYPAQEEIHSAGIMITGTLWDLYSALKENHSSDEAFARTIMTQWILETVRHLPAANTSTNHSPVNYITFTGLLVTLADQFPALTSDDKSIIKKVLAARGFYDYPTIASKDWMVVGTGTNETIVNTPSPGLFIEDDPLILRRWLINSSKDPSTVTQNLGSGLNGQLDPGETAAIWFDIQNNSNITAGGVLVTVTSNDPQVSILDSSYNLGYMTDTGLNQTQIVYGKVNGTSIVASLNASGNAYAIPIGNSYFKTNFLFNRNPMTAIWVKVSPQANHGKVVQFSVQATPSNGVTSTQEFAVTIH
jgi:hypothetical protein